MPELPDIEYIVNNLGPVITGCIVTQVAVKQPVVIRKLIPESIKTILHGKVCTSVQRHGPFLLLIFAGVEIIVHFMLEGKITIGKDDKKKIKFLCMTLVLDNNFTINFSDRRLMIKIYIAQKGNYEKIPGFNSQGIDILSDEFDEEYFLNILSKRQCQIRVFLLDQSALSAIGNAYTDEILFYAGINPGKKIKDLTMEEKIRLYHSIKEVISLGITEVARAGKPIDQKVRDHMKVRGRAGKPCPTCGTLIRSVAVHGYDAFYCPSCQPLPGDYFLQWK